MENRKEIQCELNNLTFTHIMCIIRITRMLEWVLEVPSFTLQNRLISKEPKRRENLF